MDDIALDLYLDRVSVAAERGYARYACACLDALKTNLCGFGFRQKGGDALKGCCKNVAWQALPTKLKYCKSFFVNRACEERKSGF